MVSLEISNMKAGMIDDMLSCKPSGNKYYNAGWDEGVDTCTNEIRYCSYWDDILDAGAYMRTYADECNEAYVYAETDDEREFELGEHDGVMACCTVVDTWIDEFMLVLGNNPYGYNRV